MKSKLKIIFENLDYKIILLFFIILSLFVWLDIFSFFRGDDWSFIIDFVDGKTFKDYFMVAHHGHVIPFFQFLYSIELSIFGENAICFQFLSLMIWGISSFVFFLILNHFTSNKFGKYYAILITIMFCLHPVFADIIYWIFQQGVIIHILFQFLTILFYFKILEQHSKKNTGFFFLFLIMQNYFFGNGVFFPLLFIIHYFIHRNKIVFNRFINILLAIQLIFIAIQKLLPQQEINVSILLENLSKILSTFFRFLSVSIERLFFIKQFGSNVFMLISILIFVYLCFLAFRNNRKYFYFVFLYLLISSMSIPIARFNISTLESFPIHYYYSALLFPSFFMMLILAIENKSILWVKPFTVLISLYIATFFLVNIQVKKIFSYKNLRNKEALYNAIKYSKPNYYPFEDAMFSGGKHIYQDNKLNESIQKSIMKTSYFKADSSIIKYLGTPTYNSFIINNRKVLESYNILEKNSLFNLDITYEKEQ